jgi:hypothetical protein
MGRNRKLPFGAMIGAALAVIALTGVFCRMARISSFEAVLARGTFRTRDSLLGEAVPASEQCEF